MPPRVAPLEVHRNEPQQFRDTETELDQALSFPGLRARPVDLEYPKAGGDLRLALGERVQTGAEDDVLFDTTANFFSDEVLDEASTSHDGCSEAAGEVLVHVWTAAPIIFRGDQPQANLVFKHMRRRIGLDAYLKTIPKIANRVPAPLAAAKGK